MVQTMTLLDVLVIESEVLKRLSNLREDKSAGTDGMSSRFLKAISTVIAAPVTLLFNQSLSEGSVTTDWKLANVSPIFTTVHGMQTRSSDENSVCQSVCPSVRPSVTRVNCDKNGKKICPDLYTTRKII